MILNGHFVDDWTGGEPAMTCQSACESFKNLFQQHLGMATKPEKEQPEQLPSPKQKVLGVIVNAQAEALTTEICPKKNARR